MGVRRDRSVQTEAALKDAARRQFVERGYLNTKITDITAAAGRAPGSFYDHFASKEELLQSLLADLRGQASDELAGDELAGDGDHPPHDLTAPGHLRAHLGAAWRLMQATRPVVVALLESALAGGPAAGDLWHRLAQDTAVLRDHLEYLAAQG